ncbi:MAG: bifunctional folylpolyglutamate synthase/dihydrofolate synthase [Rhizobiales bacterium]|nr:bifunctional folylpolyglutamate synthase/dihydrofolate synthase [Hyphomicrobiales bacterium]
MFDLPKYGDGICLARLTALLDVLAIDRARLRRRSVVVTGSNGKGSTAAFCAGIGRAASLRTGLFTSPHLYRFNERFRIDDTSIDDARLAELVTHVVSTIDNVSRQRKEGFGAFEAQFALACLYFQQEACDLMVFEAGIGGRYDPARLVGTATTCVASVDLEHVSLLGNSLALIASDKSDACAAGGTIVYGENCWPLRDHLLAYNHNRNVSSVFIRDEIGIANEQTSDNGQTFDLSFDEYRFRDLTIGLSGAFQVDNAAIAANLFYRWARTASVQIDDAAMAHAIRDGLGKTRWPGRLETIRRDPLTVIDVGHTPDGIARALAGLHRTHGNDDWVLVVGVSHDKSADEIVALLAPAFDTIICSSAYHKGAPPEHIAAAARRANPAATVHVAATIEEAVTLSTRFATELGRKIFVAGGLFLAIEYATAASGGQARELAFF